MAIFVSNPPSAAAPTLSIDALDPAALAPEEGFTQELAAAMQAPAGLTEAPANLSPDNSDDAAKKASDLQILPADVLLNAVGEANFAFSAQGAPIAQVTDSTKAIAETGVINLGNKNPFSNIVTGVNKVTGGKNALMQDIPDTYSMDAATAIQRLKELRSDGSAYLRSGTNIMKPNPKEVARGNRYLAEADKLEKAIENHVVKLGQPELIDQFRNARRYIAKTFTVEKALNPQTGVVDARKIAKQLDQGVPITDELALVGKYAKAFPKTTKVVAEAPAPFSVLDFYGAGAGGVVDLLTGVPALSLLAPARIGARYGLMTPQAQQMLATPQYTPRTAPFVPYQGLLNNQE
jgi:hypothetical protein